MTEFPPLATRPALGNDAALEQPAGTSENGDRMEGADDFHVAILRAWECAFGQTPVVYLSGPITTGKRFVAAILRGTLLANVLAENLAEMRGTARLLRTQIPPIVVDPSPLAVAHWSQKEYMLLWRRLIERHVREVRFMAGWEYSLGCAEEFVHATALGVATLRLDGEPILVDAGRAMLGDAVRSLSASGGEQPQLESLGAALAVQQGRLNTA